MAIFSRLDKWSNIEINKYQITQEIYNLNQFMEIRKILSGSLIFPNRTKIIKIYKVMLKVP